MHQLSGSGTAPVIRVRDVLVTSLQPARRICGIYLSDISTTPRTPKSYEDPDKSEILPPKQFFEGERKQTISRPRE